MVEGSQVGPRWSELSSFGAWLGGKVALNGYLLLLFTVIPALSYTYGDHNKLSV